MRVRLEANSSIYVGNNLSLRSVCKEFMVGRMSEKVTVKIGQRRENLL